MSCINIEKTQKNNERLYCIEKLLFWYDTVDSQNISFINELKKERDDIIREMSKYE